MDKIKALFPYKISEKAEMSYDIETGESCATYIHYALRNKNDEVVMIDKENYDKIHEQSRKDIAKKFNLKEEWISKVSIEEYEKNTERE